MTLSVKHATIAAVPDSGDGKVSSNAWNDTHTIAGDANTLLGFDNAGAGQAVTVGSGLSYSAGSLAATGLIGVNASDFGAKGDGVTDDSAALAAASAFINAAGGGVLNLTANATYIVGGQTLSAGHQGAGYSFPPNVLYPIEFNACTKPVILRGNGAIIKCKSGAKFGTFNDDGTSKGTVDPYFGGGLATPYNAMIYAHACTAPVHIENVILDGNIASLTIGGQYGDTGWQIPCVGLQTSNNTDIVSVEDVVSHHHALDGAQIDGPSTSDTASKQQGIVTGLKAYCNGRQGMSFVGGKGWSFRNCSFNWTGKANPGSDTAGVLSSNPAAGIDLEAEGGKVVRDLSFDDCEIIGNAGAGMVSDGTDVDRVNFKRCTFIGTTNYSLWPRSPRFLFEDCRILGCMVDVYGNADHNLATKFKRCHLLWAPAQSPTGALYASGGVPASTFSKFHDPGSSGLNIRLEECILEWNALIADGGSQTSFDSWHNCTIKANVAGGYVQAYGVFSGAKTTFVNSGSIPRADLATSLFINYAGRSYDSFSYNGTTYEADSDGATADDAFAIHYTGTTPTYPLAATRGARYVDASLGLVHAGKGTTNDYTLKNSAGTNVLTVPTGTLNANFAGNVAATGTVTGSNLSGTHGGTSSGTNTGDQTITLTGNVTGSGTGSFATTIPAGTVTLAMQANMATGSLIYRKTAGSGAPEVNTLATLKTDLGLTGTNSGDQTITLTGNVTGSGTGSFATTVASVPAAAMPALTGDVTTSAGAVATTLATNIVTYAKFQQVAASSLVGNATGSLANATGITLGSTLAFSGSALQTAAITGDVTASANSFATTLATNVVTYAKFQQVAASSLVGNATGSLANATGITLAGGLAFSGSTLTAAGALTPTSVVSSGGVSGTTISGSTSVLSTGTGGVGYAAGAGGTAAQSTSKATTVSGTNKMCVDITLNAAALAASTTVSFTFTNTVIAATDNLIINHISVGTFGSYTFNGRCAAGSATIDVRNVSLGSLSEAIVIRVTVLKGANT